jgi:hypothetical protein
LKKFGPEGPDPLIPVLKGKQLLNGIDHGSYLCVIAGQGATAIERFKARGAN